MLTNLTEFDGAGPVNLERFEIGKQGRRRRSGQGIEPGRRGEKDLVGLVGAVARIVNNFEFLK